MKLWAGEGAAHTELAGKGAKWTLFGGGRDSPDFSRADATAAGKRWEGVGVAEVSQFIGCDEDRAAALVRADHAGELRSLFAAHKAILAGRRNGVYSREQAAKLDAVVRGKLGFLVATSAGVY